MAAPKSIVFGQRNTVNFRGPSDLRTRSVVDGETAKKRSSPRTSVRRSASNTQPKAPKRPVTDFRVEMSSAYFVRKRSQQAGQSECFELLDASKFNRSVDVRTVVESVFAKQYEVLEVFRKVNPQLRIYEFTV